MTGGGTGIGQAGAVRLAGEGAKIVLTGRRREPLDDTANMIRAKGGEAIVAPADMGKRDEVEAVAKRIADECGGCDILVNSAGINVRNRKWADVDASAFDSVMDANLSGPFYATAVVLPMMRKQKSGLIIQISSWAGVYVSPLSRAGLFRVEAGHVACAESLNQEECVNGIRSCCILQGEVATPISLREAAGARVRRWIRPDAAGRRSRRNHSVRRAYAAACLPERDLDQPDVEQVLCGRGKALGRFLFRLFHHARAIEQIQAGRDEIPAPVSVHTSGKSPNTM